MRQIATKRKYLETLHLDRRSRQNHRRLGAAVHYRWR